MRITVGVLSRVAIACTLLSTACAPLRRTPLSPPYDLLITNARVVDGTGNPWYYGDIATKGDRIARVGPGLTGSTARRNIDAHGLVVAPGFIDMLGHSEFSILNNPTAVSKITQGITSEITGEVNSAWPNAAPTAREARSAVVPWSSLDGYFRHLEKNGTAINLGTYVAAGSVRRAIMGDASRDPTPAEMEQMGSLVEQAMREGAMGFSTGLIYPPTTFFSTEQLTRLTRHAARYGGGYASHIRNEGNGLVEAVREAITIGSSAGTWTQIRHLKSNDTLLMQAAIALVDSARRAGIDVTADQYPYTASGTGLSSILPAWVQAGGNDSMLIRLADTLVRQRLREATGDPQTNPRSRDPSRIMINSVRADSLRQYEGKRLDEVGRMRGQDPMEAAYGILLADRGATSAIYFTWSEEALRLAMRQPWVSVGQDAGAATPDTTGRGRGHPRAFGTFTRILGRYVREDSVLGLENAVRKMTSLAAQRAALDERGVLKRGMYADLVIFDPMTVIDRATFEMPQLLSSGVQYVVVNGVLVVDGGQVTGALPGRALRGPGTRR